MPYEKALLDFYYAQAKTNGIDGAWIILGTVDLDKLATNVQWIISSSVTNVNWSEGISNLAETSGHDLTILFNTNYVAVETDPVFTNWVETNTLVEIETDPVFTNWVETNLFSDAIVTIDIQDMAVPTHTAKTAVVNISDPDYYQVHFWFCDATNDLNISPAIPDVPGPREFWYNTDSTGCLSFVISTTDTNDWYLAGEVNGKISISEKISIGE